MIIIQNDHPHKDKLLNLIQETYHVISLTIGDISISYYAKYVCKYFHLKDSNSI
jgi:hypothetical protein